MDSEYKIHILGEACMEKATEFTQKGIPQPQASGKYLVIIDNNGKIQEISLDRFQKDRLYFGSNPGQCDIVINSNIVSHVHGKLKIVGNRVLFADVGSTNGTIVETMGTRRFFRGNSTYVEIFNGNILRIQPKESTPETSVVMLYINHSGDGVWRKAPILSKQISIGRGTENDVVLPHPCVSRVHAYIRKTPEGMVLVDNNSSNGILLNGRSLNRSALLKEKDVITILNSTLLYTDGMVFYKTARQGTHIDIKGVNKYVGKNRKRILNDVNCHIESNDFVAIIGGSGAGKTTLMNAISGFDKKVQGSIMYNGVDLRVHFNEWKSIIGYVPQEDIIFENLTLRRMLHYTANLKMPSDTSKAEKEKRIDQVLNMVELSEHQNTLIRKLSGGQKKRASIAVELLADPSVFFLDEPTSGLDPGTEQKLMITLNKLSKTQGKTIVMVTHTTQSLELCDKVIFMGQGGRLCFCGTTEEAKKFFDTENLVDIYNMISEDPQTWSQKYKSLQEDVHFEQDNKKQDLKKRKKGIQIRQFPILSLRYMELLKNDLPRLGILFLQPVLIALLLAVVANDKVFDIYEDTKSILFSLSCAAIWIGLFNSIQEICKERAILKREYMGDLKLPWYVLSKFAVQTLLGMIQALLITGIFTLTVGSAEEGILFSNPFMETFITMWITIEASMALGFVISSLVKSGDKAMTLAPFVLIVQLLFSGILFELKGAGEYISYATISKWSVESLGSIAGLNDLTMKIQEQIPTAEHEFQKIFESVGSHLGLTWGVLIGMSLLCMILCMILLRNLSKDGR